MSPMFERCARIFGETTMNDHEAGQYWNDNAEAWTKLARAGYDIYRNHLNTPAFLQYCHR